MQANRQEVTTVEVIMAFPGSTYIKKYLDMGTEQNWSERILFTTVLYTSEWLLITYLSK